MKIIFSRKGFDSSAGGVPSPILPDGRILSLPIPRQSDICYGDLRFNGFSIGKIVQDLTKGKLTSEDRCHLDPDLRSDMLPRADGWRPIFGQRGPAARHLLEQGIAAGDIFLFFGWFRQTEIRGGTLRYLRGALGIHALFGWLQVGEMIKPGEGAPQWAAYHPHVRDDYGPSNLIFIASEELEIGGTSCGVPGGGAFPVFRDEICLTAPYRSRSWWRLPLWLYPGEGKEPLSHHEDQSRWIVMGDHVYLRTAARGQEFVLDADQYPESASWVAALIMTATQHLA